MWRQVTHMTLDMTHMTHGRLGAPPRRWRVEARQGSQSFSLDVASGCALELRRDVSRCPAPTCRSSASAAAST
jgi:hypothetical protein